MRDPSESWGARIGRWVIWLVVGIGVLLYWLSTDPADPWGLFKGFAIGAGCALMVYWVIKDYIVQPLRSDIQALRAEVQALRKQIRG